MDLRLFLLLIIKLVFVIDTGNKPALLGDRSMVGQRTLTP
jgi:hypothetical protein